VRAHAQRFYEIQNERCFYTHDRLNGLREGELDHFIPWARYPFDSPFNLVMVSRKVNNSFRDSLKPTNLRRDWLERNEKFAHILTAPTPSGFGAPPDDAATARAISEWLYRSAQAG
jgi:CRISPR/Cas system Type II protein with McrA/HNH and RuvC-like nuclease domain